MTWIACTMCQCCPCMCQPRQSLTGYALPAVVTYAQCEKCSWWHAVGSPCLRSPDADRIDRLERTVDKLLVRIEQLERLMSDVVP